MTGQAPEPVAAMVNFAYMPCLQPAGLRIGIPFLVATRTVIEFRLFAARLDREFRGFGVALYYLAGISLLGTNDARCCDSDEHRQQT